jgi:potassium voltage-gated channel Eag-related subfamily H protein 5
MKHISFMKAKAGQLIWLKGDPVEEICLLVEGVV